MISFLSVKNYAIIQDIKVNFEKGLNIITGETGAGKSILTGALSLLLGVRADFSVLNDKEKKCIVEAEFNIKDYNLFDFFEKNNLDYDEFTIIRREINPNGKSRAFINDTPVNLIILKEFTENLIDIHSQNQNQVINNNDFKINVLDSYCNNNNLLKKYQTSYFNYIKTKNELQKFTEEITKQKADLDYLQYQFEQLEKANLDNINQQEIEEEIEKLSHAEEIKTALSQSTFYLNEADENIISNLNSIKNTISKISSYFGKATEIYNRLDSVIIEINDIASEIEDQNSNLEFDPERLENLNKIIDNIYTLQTKHNVKTIEELLEIKENINQKILEINISDEKKQNLEKKLNDFKNQADGLATELHKIREKKSIEFSKEITKIIQKLGMPNGEFKITVNKNSELSTNGISAIDFIFSANKNEELKAVSKSASGGEVSRIMLALKSIIAKNSVLRTIIFDEIDTGISGEIADKMGNLFKQISKNIQILSITHLPQIAAKGDYHFKIFKEEINNKTVTNIKLLNNNDRINEIAKMLSGEKLTDAALNNAKELLKTNI